MMISHTRQHVIRYPFLRVFALFVVLLASSRLSLAEDASESAAVPASVSIPASRVPGPKRLSASPAPAPATFVLPPAFAILNNRSFFSKTGMAASPSGSNRPQPEGMFAVRGIVFDDASFLVFIEDTASHRTLQLRPGDLVAGGKIGQISLDDFNYESGASTKRIRVGQNLMGMAVPAVVPVPAQSPATAPAGGPPDPKARPGGPGPVFEVGPNGQRVRDYVAERAGE